MSISRILARLRKERGLTQSDAAGYISRHSHKIYTNKMISSWENGLSSPSVAHFLLLCELYGVEDVRGVFCGVNADYRGLTRLNALGKSRVEEYVAMLAGNPLFVESGRTEENEGRRYRRLYDVPVAAGSGSFLDGDAYEDFALDDAVPKETDFAVRVSGDSMAPRFVDGQIIFIKEQAGLEPGEIGIFALNGDSYVKKLGHGELLSLNPLYRPIPIHAYDSFRIFGKVVG